MAKPGPKRRPAIDRFWDKVSFNGEGNCWVWQGALGAGDSSGAYGQMRDAGKTLYAHRLSYEAFSGLIPEGLHLDHLCRNRKCVNPLHLEPVTISENLRRGIGNSSINAKKTHCKRGHELSQENLVKTKARVRRCKLCAQIHNSNSAFRKRENNNNIGGLHGSFL